MNTEAMNDAIALRQGAEIAVIKRARELFDFLWIGCHFWMSRTNMKV
jgi:hypothetical protein